jgi:hypothetical protein
MFFVDNIRPVGLLVLAELRNSRPRKRVHRGVRAILFHSHENLKGAPLNPFLIGAAEMPGLKVPEMTS